MSRNHIWVEQQPTYATLDFHRAVCANCAMQRRITQRALEAATGKESTPWEYCFPTQAEWISLRPHEVPGCHLPQETGKLTFNEFAAMSYDRSQKHHPEGAHPFDLEYFIVAMTGERNELLGLLKKAWRRGPTISAVDQAFCDKVADEAVDTLTYALLILSTLGKDPEAEILRKYEEVNARLAAGGWHMRPEKA